MEKESLKLENRFNSKEEVEIDVIYYTNNGSLCINLTSIGGEFPEPYGTVTVNLDIKTPLYSAYVDTNIMPELKQFITENKIGYSTGLVKQSGFVEYPLYLFDRKRLQELDSVGLERYESANKIGKKTEEREKER